MQQVVHSVEQARRHKYAASEARRGAGVEAQACQAE